MGYVREYWVTKRATPITYRYIDWSLTVPLQMVEFYLILKAVKPDLGAGMFWRLFIGTVCMLVFGYMGEQSDLPAYLGFALGLCGWFFILFEIFAGEGGKAAGMLDEAGEHVKNSFNLMRMIVTAGWCIYPLGYFFGYLIGAVDSAALNLIYNLADMVNKIWFVAAVWDAAKKDTAAKESLLP